MEISGGSSAELARTGILVVNEGIDQARAELLGLADTADAAGKRAGDSISRGATAFSQAFVDASQQSRQYVQSLQQDYETATAAIREGLAREFITEDQARTAGREAAAAYKQGVLSIIDQGEAVGAFNGDKGAAAYRDLGSALKEATAAENAHAAAARQVLSAEQAAHAEEERRQATLRSMAAAEQAAYGEEARRQAALRQTVAAEQSAYAAEEQRQAALRSLVSAEQAAYSEEQRRAAGVRALALAQAEAIAIDKAAAQGNTTALAIVSNNLGGLGASAEKAILNMNSVRAAATSMANAAVGAVPGVGQLAGVLGSFSLGSLTTAGIMIGIAAVSYGWQKWTEDARKAKEEQDKLTEALAKWYETQRNGEAGARQLQVQATEGRVREEQSRLEELRARLNSPTANRSEGVAAAIEKEIRDVEAALRRDQAAIAAGNADIIRTISEGDVARRNAEASSLASLISGHQATEAERARALRVLQEQQALLVAYSKPPEGATQAVRDFFLKERAAIAESAKALQDALNPKPDRVTSGLATESPERQKVIADLTAQLEALRKLNVESALADQRSRDQTILLGAEGVARDLLTNRIKAEEQAQAARAKYAGQGLVLREALDAIDAEKRANDERAISKQRIADERAAQQFLNEAIKDANDLATRNAKTTHDALEDGLRLYEQSEKAARSLGSTIEHDLVQSFLHFATSGAQSFSGLVQTVEQGALRMSDAIGRSLDRQKDLLLKASNENYDHHLDATIRTIDERISSLAAIQRVVSTIGVVATAGSVGYAFGQQSQTTGNAVVGGAATGALAGYQLLGPQGAVVGGLVGAASALLGAADAHKQAARAIEDANRAIQHSLAAFGPQNSVQSALLNNTVQADAIRNAINDNLRATLKNGGNPEDAFRNTFDQITKLEREQKDNALRIAQNFWDGIAAGLHSLQGPAGDFQNQLEALRKQYEDNKAAAEALGASTESVTALYDAQVAALKAAFEEAARQQQEDLSVRRLTATGGTTRAIDNAQFAIGQRREIADLQAQHQPQELIDQVLEIQELERKYRERQLALIAQQAQEDYRVRQLAAEGHSAEAQALRLQLDQQREYQEAVKAGLDDATLAALALAQAAESAAASAKQAQEAQRALDDLQVRALTAQGNTGAADQLRFQLQQQREIEDAIAAGRSQEYLDKLKEVQRLEADARAQGQSTANNAAVARDANANATAVSYAARNQSEITGNRMADYLASILVVEREQLDVMRGRSSVPPGGIPSYAQPIGYSTTNGVQPASLAGIDVNALAQLLGARGSSPAPTTNQRSTVVVRLEHSVNVVNGKLDRTDLRAYVEEIAEELEDALARRASLQRLADGSPLLSGA